MWSDNETAVDLLGYRHLVSAVTSIVRADGLLPATIGVFGDWGGGKSSLLRMVEEDLAKDEDTLVLTFNGWLFEGYEDAKSALMGVVLDEIVSKRTLDEKAKETLKKLIKRVNWFRVAGVALKHGAAFALGGPAGLGLTVAADIAGYVKQIASKAGAGVKELDLETVSQFITEESGQEARRAIREFREDFKTLLHQTNLKRLVVLIDDLDRCLPNSIIEILEAIKLFLFVDNTAFVIGADERLVRYAVRSRFPELPGDSVGVANEYLEKLIQYPIRIPALDSAEMETYVNLLFASKASLLPNQFETVRQHVLNVTAQSLMNVRFNAGVAQQLLGTVPDELKEQLAIAQRISSVLASGLKGNPRQCKRFLNTLVLRGTMAESKSLKLQQRILAKLMLLEYLKPEWFRRLATLHAGAPADGQLARLERMASAKKTPDRTTEPLSEARGKRKVKHDDVAHDGDGNGEAPTNPPLPAEFEAWLSDPWMTAWLQSTPELGKVDLRPYFYFSRDRLGSIGGVVRGMSPAAQEAIQKLLHESEAQRLVAVRAATSLSEADAAAVFEAVVEKCELQDDLRSDPTILHSLCAWCGARPELRSQCVAFFSRIPQQNLPLSVPLKIVEFTKGNETEPAAKELLGRWSKDTSVTNFATSSTNALKRYEK
jgi:hypothetical protein